MRTRCALGIHTRVLEGSGLMQDGYDCVDCDRSAYPEVFGIAVRVLPWPSGQMIDLTPRGKLLAWHEARRIKDAQDASVPLKREVVSLYRFGLFRSRVRDLQMRAQIRPDDLVRRDGEYFCVEYVPPNADWVIVDGDQALPYKDIVEWVRKS